MISKAVWIFLFSSILTTGYCFKEEEEEEEDRTALTARNFLSVSTGSITINLIPFYILGLFLYFFRVSSLFENTDFSIPNGDDYGSSYGAPSYPSSSYGIPSSTTLSPTLYNAPSYNAPSYNSPTTTRIRQLTPGNVVTLSPEDDDSFLETRKWVEMFSFLPTVQGGMKRKLLKWK